MSLGSVLLIHVSTMFLPQSNNKAQEAVDDEQLEYYSLLGIPKFSALPEIRKAYRRATLKLQCDRMMLDWNAPPPVLSNATTSDAITAANHNSPEQTAILKQRAAQHQRSVEAFNKHDATVKESFRILGDRHLRQQYHLLQCRPSRYRIIQGPLAILHTLTHPRKWFPFLVLQSVIVAAMVNAKVLQLNTANWVLVLIPSLVYYGLVVVFWMLMMEPPLRCCRKQATWRSIGAMMSCFAQHASLWLGIFWMARYWDRAIENDNDNINWYVLSIPFYCAIAFRCHCTTAAVASLRDLQLCMVSREQVFPVVMSSSQQPQLGAQSGVDALVADSNQNTAASSNINNNTHLPDGYIVVTRDVRLLAEHLITAPLTNQELQDVTASADKMNQAVVHTSPEFRQVDHAALTLRNSVIKLAILGSMFITLLALKLEILDGMSFWIVFLPVWIHLFLKLFLASRAMRRSRRARAAAIAAAASARAPPAATLSRTPTLAAAATAETPNATITISTASVAIASSTSSEEQPSVVTGVSSANTVDDANSKGTIASVSLLTGAITPNNTPVEDTTKSLSCNNDDRIKIDTDEVSHGVSVTGYSLVKASEDSSVLPPEDEVEVVPDTIVPSDSGISPPFHIDIEAGLPSLVDTTTNYSDVVGIDSKASVDAVEISAVATPPKAALNTVVSQIAVEDHHLPVNENQKHEDFERWQSVYEHTEVRSLQSNFIPCEIFFHLLIVCLIVAKLEQDYGNTDLQNPGFNAFFIILIPFAIGLLICCAAIMFGCIQIARDELRNSPSATAVATPGEISAGALAIENDAATEILPMQAGGISGQPMTFSAHVDIHRQDLTNSDRIHFFTAVMPLSDPDVEEWLVENDDIGVVEKMTLWEQTITIADDLECRSVNYDGTITDEIGTRQFLTLVRDNLQAHFDKTDFQDQLDAIKPLDDEDNNADNDNLHYVPGETKASSGNEKVHGMECPVCCEEYRLEDMVQCEGDPMHFFCRPCFHRYATETIDAGDITGMPCADVACESMFATPTVRSNVSSWDALRMEARETERNTKVALAAKAVLKCTCGSIGIVTDTDVGDGCITCPGSDCSIQFCALCGNKWHPDTRCPPSKKMLEWVLTHAMPCPNCHTPIEKNSGCDHMHCAPPGGCGHHFSYRTGKPMSRSGTNLRGLYAA